MLLNSDDYFNDLSGSLACLSKEITVLSAFIKLNALNSEVFVHNLANKSVTVIARWQKMDLLAKASDLEVYEFCKSKGWRFGIDFNLHGKVYIIDRKEVFLGSANLTQRGLNLGGLGNNEFGTRFTASKVDLGKVEKFIASEVTWVNDELFNLLSADINKSLINKEKIESTHWSKEINEIILKPVEYLWVQELVFCSPSELLNFNLDDEKTIHDFELLGLNLDNVNDISLKSNFKRTRLFQWLCLKLKGTDLSFGGITAALHTAILDDPKPYRVDIKAYNKVIFSWAEYLDDTFEVCRPRYSQVIRLQQNSDNIG